MNVNYSGFLSEIEPKKVKMHLKIRIGLLQCKKNSINLKGRKYGSWYPDLKTNHVIGTKWVFRNKLDEDGIVTRNKARLVAKGYFARRR